MEMCLHTVNTISNINVFRFISGFSLLFPVIDVFCFILMHFIFFYSARKKNEIKAPSPVLKTLFFSIKRFGIQYKHNINSNESCQSFVCGNYTNV